MLIGWRSALPIFSAVEAERLAGHPGRVDAIGVLAEPGVDTETLHERVVAALEGTGARIHAGEDSGPVEFLHATEARELLIALSGSFGGTALMVACSWSPARLRSWYSSVPGRSRCCGRWPPPPDRSGG